jgi:hypothetical protein
VERVNLALEALVSRVELPGGGHGPFETTDLDLRLAGAADRFGARFKVVS